MIGDCLSATFRKKVATYFDGAIFGRDRREQEKVFRFWSRSGLFTKKS